MDDALVSLSPLDRARVQIITRNFYDVSAPVAIPYINKLTEHIQFVIAAGRKLGVPDSQLLIHDQSKFSADEFAAYAHYFYGARDNSAFAYAWNHHIHCNRHHWEHWCFSIPYNEWGGAL